MSYSKGKLRELETCEKKIDEAYEQTVEFAKNTRERYLQELSVVKTRIYAAAEHAISETHLHALETQTFVPVDPLAQLLWFDEPASHPVYSFEAGFHEENFSGVFHAELIFNVVGYDHMTMGEPVPSAQDKVINLTKTIETKDQEIQYWQQQVVSLKRQLNESEEKYMKTFSSTLQPSSTDSKYKFWNCQQCNKQYSTADYVICPTCRIKKPRKSRLPTE